VAVLPLSFEFPRQAAAEASRASAKIMANILFMSFLLYNKRAGYAARMVPSIAIA
jgi:hypothetical protein